MNDEHAEQSSNEPTPAVPVADDASTAPSGFGATPPPTTSPWAPPGAVTPPAVPETPRPEPTPSPWASPAPTVTEPVGVPTDLPPAAAVPTAPAYAPTAPPTGDLPPVPPRIPPSAPAASGDGPGRGSRGPGWRQFVVGVVVGALVGGGVAAGVSLATKDDSKGTTRTVVVGSASSKPVRNTSIIGKAKDVQEVLARVNGAVVAIQTGAAVDSGLFPGSSNGSSGGEGTGFVISSDGVIVTNNHVVADANGRIEVEFADGTKQAAELLGRAPEYDLAVIKVDGKNLPTVKLGSSDELQVGDQVVAVGNALALQGGLSVTEGIISGKGRVVPEEETGATLYDMLQTDAAINPGNSGGPLVSASGEVVGINTALAGGSQNVGFAISIDSAKSVIEALRGGQSVRVAFLGVATVDVTPAIAKSLNLNTKDGAVVRQVTNGAAAAKAGVKTDDVIIAIGGHKVASPEDVGAEIRRSKPGDKVDVTVERGGQDVTLTIELGVRPDSVG